MIRPGLYPGEPGTSGYPVIAAMNMLRVISAQRTSARSATHLGAKGQARCHMLLIQGWFPRSEAAVRFTALLDRSQDKIL